MGPECPLPLPDSFQNPDEYVESLLRFGTTSDTLQSLCGGVHILDFFTRTPDLYSLVLPESWRVWFRNVEIMDLLDLLMREDLAKFTATEIEAETHWRGYPMPPPELISYIHDIRRHSLNRSFSPPAKMSEKTRHISRNVAVGMKEKKVHEVALFSDYVDGLTARIESSNGRRTTHLVDFGSGQNYLGRALASEPFNKHIVAVESRPHNVEGARRMDVHAKLAPKPKKIVNKKAFRAGLANGNAANGAGIEACDQCNQPPPAAVPEEESNLETPEIVVECEAGPVKMQCKPGGKGTIQYVEHRLQDGNLAHVVEQIIPPRLFNEELPEGIQELTISKSHSNANDPDATNPSPRSLMVISLHSCGNLLHHGLRSLILNPDVHAVALIGCCYNLLTERLGPPTYKLPSLRTNHPRLEATANAFDPHGFPMSAHLVNYAHPGSREVGIRLNITARMMAVQAPQNWGQADSELFFSRHFYRALLQRIFLERGVVSLGPVPAGANGDGAPYLGVGDGSGGTQPIILGSLRKACYKDFRAYVRGSIDKLINGPDAKPDLKMVIQKKMVGITDEEVSEFEERYRLRKKELSITWSLMAFSAAVIESMIVVDRWLWLREQQAVKECWVEPVFEFKWSPRNLVVVGIKR